MSEDESNIRKDDVERVKRYVTQLGEHFECVQIFVSRHIPAELDGTISTNQGSGNWFARYGQIREWITYEEQRMREHAKPRD